MTTQTNLKIEQLPYGYEAGLVSNLIALPGKVIARLGKLIATLDDALAMRDRYAALDRLNDATLKEMGITRETIPQIVATEAGLFEPAAKEPVAHNSNATDVRTAA